MIAEANRLATLCETIKIPYELSYLEGSNFENYLNDMKIAQAYAALNRKLMAETILKGKALIVPLNMRDGSILATGLGNPAWNYSAFMELIGS